MARLLHLSDLHVVAPGARASGVLDTGALLAQAVEALLARAAALGPLDAVLITGDISDDASPESYALARAELARFGLPLLVIPGNHDGRAALHAAFGDAAGPGADGPLDWAVDIAGARIIGLDTLVEGQGGGRLQPESLAFLARSLPGALPRAPDQACVVALHHPPLRTGIAFMDAIGLENAQALEAVLAASAGPVLVVAGHVHGVYLGRLGPHPVITAPSLCSGFALDRRPDAPVGFFAGPTGAGLIDTAGAGGWTMLPLDHGAGPFPF